MESLIAMLGNWKTTLTGLATAVVLYMAGVGNKLPETKQEWTALVLGVLALMLGVASKDATTGSRPKAGK